jgi:glucose/arabinose dehydrogenase
VVTLSGVDFDIGDLQVAPLVNLNTAIPLDLLVTNGGSVNGSADATIIGAQDGMEVYNVTQAVSDDLGGGSTLNSFPPAVITPSVAGEIQWTATIADQDTDADQFGAVTEVIDGPIPVPLGDPIAEPIGTSKVSVILETVADGMVSPVHGTSTPALPNRLFVVDQPGKIYSIDLLNNDLNTNKNVFMDVTSRIFSPLGIFPFLPFDERGLLGFAFHPDYGSNGLIYTYTSEHVDGAADFSTMPTEIVANHQAVISEWQVTDPTGSAEVDLLSRRELLRIDEPQFNHNGGTIAFGPDGMLYITLGDGGGADDVDGPLDIDGPMVGHGKSNGQNAENPLGSLLRIDPTGTNSANGQYGIPVDNPFVALGDSRLDEIYAYGLRNMYRFSFDRKTGELYGADVGQNDIEEVNIIVNGGNYGWNHKEGSFFFEPNGNLGGFVTNNDRHGDLPADLIDPLVEYDHDEGISVTGGYVYRGSRYNRLRGAYIFADWSRSFSEPQGRLLVYLPKRDRLLELLPAGQASVEYFITGFGEDNDGEIYVLGNESSGPFGDPHTISGVVLRIAPNRGGRP